jgi:HKD family nuclease
MELLLLKMKKMLVAKRPVDIYTSGYMRITEPRSLEFLISEGKKTSNLYTFFNQDDKFHAKFFYFQLPTRKYALILDSSNISTSGLAEEGELNVPNKGEAREGGQSLLRNHRDH